MTNKKNEEAYRRLITNEANKAKESLARLSYELDELGYHRKAASAMTLVYRIEEWQNRK